MPPPSEITRLLAEWNRGDLGAFDRLMPLVYEELRQMARRQLRSEKAGHTLAPEALVNEFYMRLVGQREVEWQHRAEFFGAAAKLMRRILVDYARKRRAQKRGGLAARIDLPAGLIASWADEDLEAIDEALEQLAKA